MAESWIGLEDMAESWFHLSSWTAQCCQISFRAVPPPYTFFPVILNQKLHCWKQVNAVCVLPNFRSGVHNLGWFYWIPHGFINFYGYSIQLTFITLNNKLCQKVALQKSRGNSGNGKLCVSTWEINCERNQTKAKCMWISDQLHPCAIRTACNLSIERGWDGVL